MFIFLTEVHVHQEHHEEANILFIVAEVFPTIHHNIVEIMIRVFLLVPTYYSLWPRYFHTSHYCSIVEVLIRVFLFVLFIYLCYMTNMNNAISM